MPAFCFPLPRLSRSRRSSHSHSSPQSPQNEVTPSPVLSSRPSSTHGTQRQAVDITMNTSHSPAPCDLTPGRHCVHKPPEDSCGQPPQLSRPITLINVVDPGSVTQLPVHVPHPPDSTDSIQSYYPPCSLAAALKPSFEQQRTHPGKDLPASLHPKQEIFKDARDFSVVGSNLINNKGSISFISNLNTSNQFMEKLLNETIRGAASNSSARDPPPRCHPGTRLAILERCLYFIAHCNDAKKMRWVVGAAGVGKSAVMQSVTESQQVVVAYSASVFFSINGRSDGTKAVITFSYQFAAKSDLYRQVIEDQVNRDPSLLQSSMAVQFENFIVQPFIFNPVLNSAGRVVVIIDGLDECKNPHTQVELLRLIYNFCISYPSSPIVWLVASRPEPHITSFFSRAEVTPVYEKEEILIECHEARADVERFLRHELAEIGRLSHYLGPYWPDEQTLWKLANAAGGLFAYAHTVVRYIGDSSVGDPVSQLSDVLNVIDELPMSDIPAAQHPLALLDALYARILSNVPSRNMMNTRKLLLALVSNWDWALEEDHEGKTFIVLCNWLAMTAEEAYGALNGLRSVLDFPQRHEAHKKPLKSFHKSFIDYISRTVFSPNAKLDAQQLTVSCAFRVLEEAPNGIDIISRGQPVCYGALEHQSGAGDRISITWPARDNCQDKITQLSMYQLAIGEVLEGIKRGNPVFQSKSYIKLLTTRFSGYLSKFPYHELCHLVFDKSRRQEFMNHGILKQIPAKAIDVSRIVKYRRVIVQFRRPITTELALHDTWKSSCEHKRVGRFERGEEQNWTTDFLGYDCRFCFSRFRRQLANWINQFPDHAVPIMFSSAGHCSIEVEFADPEDDLSEWTYWFWLSLSLEQRKELGSTI